MSESRSALGVLARHVPPTLVAWSTISLMIAFVALVATVIAAIVLDFEFKLAGVVFGRDSDWQTTAVSEAPAVPEGVIVASVEQCARLGNGWVTFEAGQGRTIVGVGSTTDERGETRAFPRPEATGGEFRHILTIDELPAHNHPGSEVHEPVRRVLLNASGGHSLSGGSEVGALPVQSLDLSIASQGQGQPHNNLPPYIVLYLCIKEAG